MRTKNIILSTTRQWNPGDEFILLGTINLLKKYLSDNLNLIIYNRNPQIRPVYGRKKFYKSFLYFNFFNKFEDNSIHEKMKTDFIDLVIFAGTPAWVGQRSRELYKIILRDNIPSAYLGIGMNKEPLKLKDYEKEVIKKSLLILTREKYTENFLKDYGAKFVPCPAFFSSKTNREVKKVKRIGLIYAISKTNAFNNVKISTSEYINRLYKEILEKYKAKFEIEFVAHYIEELPEFYKNYPKETIKYSYDSKDYLEIYNKYDLVIGSRVHGIGISASLGIPGIMIGHDGRADTVKGFLAEIITEKTEIKEALKIIDEAIKNINLKSKQLLEHKKNVEELYKREIEKIKEKIC